MLLKNKIKVNVNAIAFALVILALGSSCKKKNESAPPQVSNPVINSPYSVSTASVFSGFLNTFTLTEFVGSINTYSANHSEALFYSSPISTPVYNMGIKINSLLHSYQFMGYDTTWKSYRDQNSTNLNSELWQVSGSNGIPSFNFWNNATPSCNNFNVTPDSISKSTGFTFSITGVTNVTPSGFEFELYDGVDVNLDIKKPVINGDNVITITPTELSNLNLSSGGIYGNVSISLENIQNLNFYGKDFQFRKRNMFSKRIKICP